MRSIVCVFLLAVAALPLVAQEKSSALAEVREVTVFTNGAEIANSARVNLPKGSVKLIIQNVAKDLDIKSVQLAGPDGMTVLSISQESDPDIVFSNSTHKRLKDSLDRAVIKQELLENKQHAAQGALNILNNDKLLGGNAGSVNLGEISKLVDYYQLKAVELKTQIAKFGKELVEQHKVVAKLQEQLRVYTGDGGQLAIQLVNSRPVQGDLTIRYMTYSANWQAYYDLKANSIAQPLQLLYKARVTQYTGVDWKNVRLSLSTGNPSQSGNAPILQPSYANYYTAEAIMARRNAIQNRVQSFGSSAVLEEVSIVGATAKSKIATPQTAVAENQLNVTFDIDIPYDIASNGLPHSVTLKEYNQPAVFKYYAVPKLDKDVFLMAEITDFERLNLVPGEANIIFENMFAGQSFIDPNVTTDTLNLSMGRDKSISVKRERILDQKSTQISGGSKRQVYTYELRVRNNKSNPVNLLLKDQYPISTDKSIEIELVDAAGASINKETGVLTWKLVLKPGETQTYRFTFNVKHPKDKNVVFN